MITFDRDYKHPDELNELWKLLRDLNESKNISDDIRWKIFRLVKKMSKKYINYGYARATKEELNRVRLDFRRKLLKVIDFEKK